MINKRKHRRNRHKKKQYLRYMDILMLNKLKHSYNKSMASWGGTRCPGCGKSIRPAYLLGTDYSEFIYQGSEEGFKRTGRISAFGNACDSLLFKGKCPGINYNWLSKQVDDG